MRGGGCVVVVSGGKDHSVRSVVGEVWLEERRKGHSVNLFQRHRGSVGLLVCYKDMLFPGQGGKLG